MGQKIARVKKVLEGLRAVDLGVIEKTWCIENIENMSTKLTPESFLQDDNKCRSQGRGFYVSCIIQGGKKIVKEFARLTGFNLPAFISGDVWKGFRDTDPLWVFWGFCQKRGKLLGRPEHTDSVTHDGTWHQQIAGKKLWYVRPMEEHDEWNGNAPKLLPEEGNKTRDKKGVLQLLFALTLRKVTSS